MPIDNDGGERGEDAGPNRPPTPGNVTWPVVAGGAAPDDDQPARVKSWSGVDRVKVLVLTLYVIGSLTADFAVISNYMTQTDVMPGLVDDPWKAYLFASVPIGFFVTLVYLPSWRPRKAKLKVKSWYSWLAALVFIVWLVSFAFLFSGGLGSGGLESAIDSLISGAPPTADPMERVLLLIWMFAQVTVITLTAANSTLSIFLTFEDRRIDQRTPNDEKTRNRQRRRQLKEEMGVLSTLKSRFDAHLQAAGQARAAYEESAVASYRNWRRGAS